MANVRVFVSFDRDHDADLYDRLLAESLTGALGFEISAKSEATTAGDPLDERALHRIRSADEVVVICGEHTDDSERMSAELRLVQQEQKPYFLLWGRRERMCTRPAQAKPNDSMYSWTREILQSQIALTLRNSRPLDIPSELKRNPHA